MSTRRTSFQFPAESVRQLAVLRTRTYLDNDADVIRLALGILDSMLELAELNCKVFVQSQDKKHRWPYSPYRPFDYPGLDRPRSNGAAEAKGAVKNFFFTGDAVDRLDSIRRRSDVTTNSDAIRLALTCLDQLLTVDDNGDSVVVVERDGESAVLSLFNPQARQAACERAKRAKELVPS